MSYQLICDICGKPITRATDYKLYKIKEKRCYLGEARQKKIHAHTVCIEKVVNSANPESPVIDDDGDLICPSCGAEVADSDKFCSHCGKRLK